LKAEVVRKTQIKKKKKKLRKFGEKRKFCRFGGRGLLDRETPVFQKGAWKKKM